MKKTLAIAGAITAVGVSAFAAPALVSAHNNGDNVTFNRMAGDSSLVTKLAEKFHLNKDDVQKVFDEEHQAHKAQMEKRFEDRLSRAVKDGKLTQDQADKLKAKHQEMRTYMESMKDKDPQEARDAMKQKMDEFRQWADDNDIPDEFRMMGGRVEVSGKAGDREFVRSFNTN